MTPRQDNFDMRFLFRYPIRFGWSCGLSEWLIMPADDLENGTRLICVMNSEIDCYCSVCLFLIFICHYCCCCWFLFHVYCLLLFQILKNIYYWGWFLVYFLYDCFCFLLYVLLFLILFFSSLILSLMIFVPFFPTIFAVELLPVEFVLLQFLFYCSNYQQQK